VKELVGESVEATVGQETILSPAAAAAADKTQFKVPSFGAAWAKQVGAFRVHFNADQNKINAEKRTFYCDVLPLRKVLDAQITGRISTLQKWIKQVGKSGLGTSDVATVDSELNGLITDRIVRDTQDGFEEVRRELLSIRVCHVSAPGKTTIASREARPTKALGRPCRRPAGLA